MPKKAKVLASLAAKSPLILYAGKTLTTAGVVDAEYRNHECASCGLEVAFGSQVNGFDPFCPSCGGEFAPAETVVVIAPQEDQLTSIGCPECGTLNVVEDRALAAFGGEIHCAACAAKVAFKAPVTAAEDDLVVDVDFDPLEENDFDEETAGSDVEDQFDEQVDWDNSSIELKDGDGNVVDAAVEEAGPGGSGPGKPRSSNGTKPGAKGTGARPGGPKPVTPNHGRGTPGSRPKGGVHTDHPSNRALPSKRPGGRPGVGTDASFDPEQETASDVDKAAADAADAVARGAAAAADAARTAAEAVDELDVDLTDSAAEDGDVEVKLDEDANGETARLLAFVDGVHVMTLNKEHAGENADLLVQASFHRALEREAAKSGFKALAGYGFEPVVVRLPIAKLVDTRVQAALAEEKAKVTASLEDVTANFEQSAKIAAVALTHNFYRNRTNPLQEQLVASLEGMGFKQARKVVKQAMLAAGPQFVTAMLELADEILAKPVDVRNELSDTLTQLNPMALASDECADEEEEDESDDDFEFASTENLTNRLTAGVIPTRTKKGKRVVTASDDRDDLATRLRELKGH